MKDFERRFFVLAVLLSLIWHAKAQWKANEVPSPLVNWAACGRQDKSFVCNPDGLLLDDTADAIDDLIDSLAQYTMQCGKGVTKSYQLGIAVMSTGKYGPWDSDDVKISTYAKDLQDSWGIGESACGNGVLFLLMYSDRLFYVSSGAAAARILTDNQLGNIFDSTTVPELKAGMVDAAVRDTVQKIIGLLDSQSKNNGNFINEPWKLVVVIFGAIVGATILLVSCIFYCFNKTEKRREQVREKIAKLQKARDQVKASQQSSAGMPGPDGCHQPPTMCSLCLEDFKNSNDVGDQTFTVILPCGHVLHKRTCAKQHLVGKDSCPLCHIPFQPQDFPPLRHHNGAPFYRPAYSIYDRVFLDYHVQDLKEKFSDVTGVENFCRPSSPYRESDKNWVSSFKEARDAQIMAKGGSTRSSDHNHNHHHHHHHGSSSSFGGSSFSRNSSDSYSYSSTRSHSSSHHSGSHRSWGGGGHIGGKGKGGRF